MRTSFAIFLLLAITIFAACSKKSEQSTALQISVKEFGNATVAGATVKLYLVNGFPHDLNNPIATQVSNTNGDVLFTDLLTAEYTWIAEIGCFKSSSNWGPVGSIKPNMINYGSTYLSQKGDLQVTNNTSETYLIRGNLIHGINLAVPPNSTKQFSGSIGIDTIRITSASNPANNRDTAINFVCGLTNYITCP